MRDPTPPRASPCPPAPARGRTRRKPDRGWRRGPPRGRSTSGPPPERRRAMRTDPVQPQRFPPRFEAPATGTSASHIVRKGLSVSILWIIVIVLIVLALLGFFGRGRFYG